MSNSIWHKPDQKPERNEDILVEYTSTNGQSYYIVDSLLNKLLQPKRWAYLSDIIAQANKAERAIWWLKEIVKNHRYTPITTAEMALKELENDKKN